MPVDGYHATHADAASAVVQPYNHSSCEHARLRAVFVSGIVTDCSQERIMIMMKRKGKGRKTKFSHGSRALLSLDLDDASQRMQIIRYAMCKSID